MKSEELWWAVWKGNKKNCLASSSFKKKSVIHLEVVHLCSTRDRWDAGPHKRPSTYFFLINVGLQEQYALRWKEHAYMSCTYTKISLTRNETSVFFPCLLRFASMTEGLTDVCVCIDCSAKRLKCFSVLLHWYNETDHFDFYSRDYESSSWGGKKRTQWSSNVY